MTAELSTGKDAEGRQSSLPNASAMEEGVWKTEEK
jgi:hypothetical protein